jgi:hypothetical protein
VGYHGKGKQHNAACQYSSFHAKPPEFSVVKDPFRNSPPMMDLVCLQDPSRK